MGLSKSKQKVQQEYRPFENESQLQNQSQNLNNVTTVADYDIGALLQRIEENDTKEAIDLVQALEASEIQQQQNQQQQDISEQQGALTQIEQQEIQEAINAVEAVKILEQSGEEIDWELNKKIFITGQGQTFNGDLGETSTTQYDIEQHEIQEAIDAVEVVKIVEQNEDQIDWQLDQKGSCWGRSVTHHQWQQPVLSGWQCRTCTQLNTDMDSQECSVCHMGREETECPICLLEIEVRDLFLVGMCSHHFHKNCIKQAVLTDMNSNMVPIQCPMCKTSKCEQCALALGRGPEQEGGNCCILSQGDIKDLINCRDYERYLTIEARETCKTYQYFQCPGPNCGNYYEIQENQDRFVCPICEFNFCIQCGVPWHKNSDCQKYQSWRQENNQGDQKFEEMRKKFGMKQCPKCHLHVIKDSPQQCNKITCNNCNPRVIFCWICGNQIQGYQHFNDNNSPCNGKLWQGVNTNVA